MTNLMTKLKTGIAIGALALGTMMGAAGAEANAVYTYVGQNFNSADSPFTTSMHIEIQFELANELGENTALTTITNDVLNFYGKVKAGNSVLYDINGSNVNSLSVKIGTSGGVINDWFISMTDFGPACALSFPTSTTCHIASIADSQDIASMKIPGDLNTDIDAKAIGDGNFPGIWSVEVTGEAPSPEVTGLMLSGLGLMGFAALRRK